VTLVLAILTVLLGQAFVVSRGWLGTFAPDPLVPIAAYLALYWPRRSVLPCIVLLGWVRALVLVEPAGGQVLAALISCAIVAGLRPHLLEFREFGYVLGTLILAGCWSMAAALITHASGVSVIGGRELVLGSLLAVPLAGVAVNVARRYGETA
jgi:hypothetical protein